MIVVPNERLPVFEEAECDTPDYVPKPDEADEVECEDIDLDSDCDSAP